MFLIKAVMGFVKIIQCRLAHDRLKLVEACLRRNGTNTLLYNAVWMKQSGLLLSYIIVFIITPLMSLFDKCNYFVFHLYVCFKEVKQINLDIIIFSETVTVNYDSDLILSFWSHVYNYMYNFLRIEIIECFVKTIW